MSHFFNNYVSSTFCCGEIKSVERIYFLCKHKPQTRTANSSKHFVVLELSDYAAKKKTFYDIKTIKCEKIWCHEVLTCEEILI